MWILKIEVKGFKYYLRINKPNDIVPEGLTCNATSFHSKEAAEIALKELRYYKDGIPIKI